ncbi:MAG TPA: hypothetical protein VLM42_00645 [Bryobacteraceae bacterium]|nr:hypothetical protein [Bryobacteraceae bacterium]
MHSKRSAIFALTLFLGAGITANAQSTAITLSFTGTGNGSSAGFFLNGTGTFTPLGSARLQITGIPAGSSTSLAFAFLLQDNSTLAAESAATTGPGTLTGTANITGGTGAYAGATGSFSFTLTAPFGSQILPFTLTGSGALGEGAICGYVLDSGGQAFPAAGGTGTVNITTATGCPWSFAGAPGWVTNATAGTGSGALTYLVTANAGADRSSVATVGGVPFEVEQEAATIPGLSLIGTMPHLAALENWTTSFTMVNKSASSATARLSLFGDAIDPTGNGPLTLPLAFPQPADTLSGPLLAATFDRTLAANASLIVNTAGAQVPPVAVGSAQLAATGAVDGFAIFHLIPGAQEAVVPMETRTASSYLLPFDNTGGVVLGIAVENVSAQTAMIPVVIRGQTGAPISLPGTTLSLAGNGHTSFVLSVQYPKTAGQRGTIEFDTPAGGRISVLGIRTTPLGTSTTLTTIPALANVGTTGGSIAQIATGNGWQTTFVIVNTGTAAAQAHLKFFMDDGAPLAIPIGPPGVTTSTSSSVDQTVAAGATLLLQSAKPLSDPSPTIGSAQLTTDGNVGGFVIFRYNPNGQEAVVPLESRNASTYILAFDNTGGTATGIALNSVSSQAVSIPVVVRNDAGTPIANDTIALAANGHLAFTLGTDKYLSTNGIRGTIEFDTPAGAQIGALGIRIPVAHTFTTLPALVR